MGENDMIFVCRSELWVNIRWFMCKSELWENTWWFLSKSELLMRGDRHTDRQTDRHEDTQTQTHINTMTWSGLGAGPSENKYI